MKKLYIVQKYVVASSIPEALKLERSIKPDDIWLDTKFKEMNMPILTAKKDIGFKR